MTEKAVQKGVAILELVIILPLLFAMLFGIIEFGLMLYDKAILTNASREAARAAVKASNKGVNMQSDAESAVKAMCGLIISFKGNPCGSGVIQTVIVTKAADAVGTPIEVTVSYDFSTLIISGFTPVGKSVTISSQTVMYLQ